ncbi:MAG: hypothetical protein HZB56_15715 [Deltaproteobacteria bacterium]|nr:hypothetical protein [Deltaproteobacteria bacterium]
MKRPTRNGKKKNPKRKVAEARKPARKAAAGKKSPARKAAAPRPAARKSPARRSPAPAAVRRRTPAKVRRGPLPEGDRQLSDPIEAAEEDVRVLPEKALFDRDDSGRDDDLAEMLGEEFVRSVTSGEEQGVELRDEAVPEEEGGPFVESSGQKEFANTEDDSEVEALPTARAPQTRLLR